VKGLALAIRVTPLTHIYAAEEIVLSQPPRDIPYLGVAPAPEAG